MADAERVHCAIDVYDGSDIHAMVSLVFSSMTGHSYRS